MIPAVLLAMVLGSTSARANEAPAGEEAASVEASPARLREYKRQHLERRGYSETVSEVFVMGGTAMAGTTSRQAWGVFDGRGGQYNVPRFAQLVGDEETQLRLRRRWRNWWLVGGGALAGTVPATWYAINQVKLAEELFDQGRRFEAASDAAMIRGMGGVLAGMTCLLVATAAFSAPFGGRKRIKAYYSPEEADHWVDDYNQALRSELGLSERDVLSIDLD